MRRTAKDRSTGEQQKDYVVSIGGKISRKGRVKQVRKVLNKSSRLYVRQTLRGLRNMTLDESIDILPTKAEARCAASLADQECRPARAFAEKIGPKSLLDEQRAQEIRRSARSRGAISTKNSYSRLIAVIEKEDFALPRSFAF